MAISTTQPESTPVSPLRQRMLEDMAMRGLRTETQRDYIRVVKSFATFLGRSPDTATAEDIVCTSCRSASPHARGCLALTHHAAFIAIQTFDGLGTLPKFEEISPRSQYYKVLTLTLKKCELVECQYMGKIIPLFG